MRMFEPSSFVPIVFKNAHTHLRERSIDTLRRLTPTCCNVSGGKAHVSPLPRRDDQNVHLSAPFFLHAGVHILSFSFPNESISFSLYSKAHRSS
mmetsp:Transcript_34548/g.68312  ORF Transcript_34548/g.68312 Transcript_34548/m.68312 type:complete len:94 (-) Transcript_34548:540-821(-)